jgi:hypothetical protein
MHFAYVAIGNWGCKSWVMQPHHIRGLLKQKIYKLMGAQHDRIIQSYCTILVYKRFFFFF